MKWISFITVLLFVLPGFADLERWQKWEVERNDLQSNEKLYHKLPDSAELKAYQTETLYLLEVDPRFVDTVSAESVEIPAELKTADGKVKFFIHPSSLELFKELISHGKLTKVAAKPTTSPRTFFVADMMVKVSLSDKVNGAIRTVYPMQMQRATAISSLLANLPESSQKENGFGFLPEPIGVFDKTPNSPFGFLVRKIPEHIRNGTTTLVPVLSYVAKNQGASLLEVDAKTQGISAIELVERYLIPALVKSYAFAAQYGVVLEAHQQNTLLELDSKGSFTGRVFYRDLDGARIDFNLREKLNLPTKELLKVQDSHWIFDLENLQKMRENTFVPRGRPVAWSPVLETAFQRYMVGSSIYLLRKAVQDQKGYSPFRIEKIIYEELQKSSPSVNSCQAVFR
ncbi:IucA/IucC family protein [Bdellovibrio sp. ZAP7]|uniref:IucA/IucC family protein n=1 Tax=Bdellovibrio sp. ZAP7 TaxID=2231053 RepID=UPI001AF02798|nr:IucA/IucC family protein [Bdellovibrio sp. ZAP7]